jgi:hypothetical protein
MRNRFGREAPAASAPDTRRPPLEQRIKRGVTHGHAEMDQSAGGTSELRVGIRRNRAGPSRGVLRSGRAVQSALSDVRDQLRQPVPAGIQTPPLPHPRALPPPGAHFSDTGAGVPVRPGGAAAQQASRRLRDRAFFGGGPSPWSLAGSPCLTTTSSSSPWRVDRGPPSYPRSTAIQRRKEDSR